MKKMLALVLALTLALTMMASVASAEGGSVYYLNFKPEADEAWQTLAKTYTEKTGVPVTIVTAASGKYEETLTAEMDKGDSAPSLFQIGSKADLADWADYVSDLRGTALFNELTTEDFNVYGENGEAFGVGYCYETFGIITNKALLEKAGYTVADIKDFASLKAIAEDIHARSAELGFDAFTSSGMDGSSSWRFAGHLTNMPLFYEARDDAWTEQPATIKGTYLDNFKLIWDLYINNSATAPTQLATATGDQAEAEFGEGKAVFFQNGTWEYGNLTGKFGMKDEDLTMIPIYCGVEGEEMAGLCSGTENCWAINNQASEANQKASLDFLYWVVTSDEGTTMMAQQFGAIPFKSAKVSSNIFISETEKYIADGKYAVTWAFNYTPNTETWRAPVAAALTQYAAGGSWDDVVTAFVQGWATQYANQ